MRTYRRVLSQHSCHPLWIWDPNSPCDPPHMSACFFLSFYSIKHLVSSPILTLVRYERSWNGFCAGLLLFWPFELFPIYFKGSSFKEVRTFLCSSLSLCPMPGLYSRGIQDCPT